MPSESDEMNCPVGLRNIPPVSHGGTERELRLGV